MIRAFSNHVLGQTNRPFLERVTGYPSHLAGLAQHLFPVKTRDPGNRGDHHARQQLHGRDIAVVEGSRGRRQALRRLQEFGGSVAAARLGWTARLGGDNLPDRLEDCVPRRGRA